MSNTGVEHRQCEERRTTPVDAEAERQKAVIARGWKAVAILAGVILLYEFFAYLS
jgi:hypothetical protein